MSTFRKISIYVECLITNKISYNAVMLILVSTVWLVSTALLPQPETMRYPLLYKIALHGFGIITMIIGLVIFFFTGFGMNSYILCKRAFKHMCQYEQSYSGDTLCEDTAWIVARRHFKEKFPERYARMVKNQRHNLELPKAMIVMMRTLQKDE